VRAAQVADVRVGSEPHPHLDVPSMRESRIVAARLMLDRSAHDHLRRRYASVRFAETSLEPPVARPDRAAPDTGASRWQRRAVAEMQRMSVDEADSGMRIKEFRR